jgi:hypothetical protein
MDIWLYGCRARAEPGVEHRHWPSDGTVVRGGRGETGVRPVGAAAVSRQGGQLRGVFAVGYVRVVCVLRYAAALH